MARKNEWGDSLEKTIIKSRAQGGLLVYSMVEGEIVEVGINGSSPEGVNLDESRIITARFLGSNNGALEVVEDTSIRDSWVERKICLGSYIFKFSSVESRRPALLRGYIAHNAGVVVDMNADHFEGNTRPDQLMAEYSTLSLEHERIF